MPADLFSLFDPEEDVEIARRNLPHWEQAGKTYFITFRTSDSMPRAVIDAWYQARNAWLKRHNIDPSSSCWRECVSQLAARMRREFHQTFSEQFHSLLDDCHGDCVLKCPRLARFVGNSLLHFDGQRYEMGDFVVMPNHVHMLVQFLESNSMRRQCESWKHFTATQINHELGRAGSFWQGESFDHLVRSSEQFTALRQYIAENPRKARLPDGAYLHHVRPT